MTMCINSHLPFKSLFFRHWDLSGEEVGVLIVKGSFGIVENGPARYFTEHQQDILLTDEYCGEANVSSPRQESDLAPFKPRTDVTFDAAAYSPEEKRLESWPVRLEVGRRLTSGFHVYGERHWEPLRSGLSRKWKMSAPETMKSLPLRYDHAYGGVVRTSDTEKTTYAYNPVGCGMLSDYLLAQGNPIAAPRIGLAAEFSAAQPDREMTVCGCSPVGKPWLPRLALAGTFDDAWLRERHPRMPEDYKYAFWNAAPLNMQADSYLSGGETLRLQGLRHDPRPYSFSLPGVELQCDLTRATGPERHLLKLDTVHCCVADMDQSRHWMALTWRLMVSDPDDVRAINLVTRNLPGAKE